MGEWKAAIIFMVIALAVAMGTLAAAWLLRVSATERSVLKPKVYECGEEPDGGAWIRFHPRYYLVALVFVLFDVEAVFLFPWALTIRKLGLLALGEMFLFIAILMLGWLYAVRKGALKWR